jgi:riboflavin kinase/FMN adenylyltransferase
MIHKQGIEKHHNTCITFGCFDGVHKGHKIVLEKLVEVANKRNLSSLVLSMYTPDEKVLTTEAEKEYYFKKFQPDIMVSCELTEKIKQMDAAYFVKSILIEQLGAKVIVVGEGCCFGEKLDGNLALLKGIAEGMGIQVVPCETVMEGDRPISAEILKTTLHDCDFESYMRMCDDHPYVMIGDIVHGKALGRTVGMPTANLNVCTNKLIPPDGVYATISTVDGQEYQGLTNIGKRPSVDNFDLVTIETFLLDFAKDIYGKPFVLQIYFYIRGVIKFNNLSEVQNQVQKDLESTRIKLNTSVNYKVI